MNPKAEQIVVDVYNGNLAGNLKRNSRFTLAGMAIGAVAGIVVATFTGKCRICFAIWGGIAGGATGYLASKKETTHGCCGS